MLTEAGGRSTKKLGCEVTDSGENEAEGYSSSQWEFPAYVRGPRFKPTAFPNLPRPQGKEIEKMRQRQHQVLEQDATSKHNSGLSLT